MLTPLRPPAELPIESLRDWAEENLRKVAQLHRAHPTKETLTEVWRMALRMLFYAPERAKEVMPLLNQVLDRSTPPPTRDSPTKS